MSKTYGPTGFSQMRKEIDQNWINPKKGLSELKPKIAILPELCLTMCV